MEIDKDKGLSADTANLRHRAEERLSENRAERSPPRIEEKTQRLVHELEVHQIELEMQNAELRQARDELEKALEKYTDLYDFAPVSYFTLDRDGVIGAVNLSGASLLGIECARLPGRRFELFIPVSARPFFFDFLGKVFASQGKQSCELTLTREGNHPHFVQIEALACNSGHECRVAIIDISERRQLEEQLKMLHTDLAARAIELETANIELEAFNYSVSHDLRKPLAVINGYCQVVQELYGNSLDEQCRGYIQEMYEGTLRMNRLIDTLLDFSRVSRIEMRHELVDLSKIAEDLARGQKLAEPERRVTFRIAAGITANGDAGLLRVVLDNLIDNAWKYSGNREETVIEFGATEVDGKQACFIRDNGLGFDRAQAEKLFIPFLRLTGTEEFSGHGIGLATVDRIVRRHGGRVWAESEPGKGATFLFTLE